MNILFWQYNQRQTGGKEPPNLAQTQWQRSKIYCRQWQSTPIHFTYYFYPPMYARTSVMIFFDYFMLRLLWDLDTICVLYASIWNIILVSIIFTILDEQCTGPSFNTHFPLIMLCIIRYAEDCESWRKKYRRNSLLLLHRTAYPSIYLQRLGKTKNSQVAYLLSV